jgi:hypothetical protein
MGCEDVIASEHYLDITTTFATEPKRVGRWPGALNPGTRRPRQETHRGRREALTHN